jgi:hypothetical protein
MKTTPLYRPVGPKELALIEASGWKAFPPRLPDQPIFYPVMNEDYAVQIARDWNVRASGSGYVTRFEVQTDFLSRYDEQSSVAMFIGSCGFLLKNCRNSINTSSA